jgi:hypothetical protein
LAGSYPVVAASQSPTSIVKQMNKAQLAELLMAIADEIQQGNNTQELIPA